MYNYIPDMAILPIFRNQNKPESIWLDAGSSDNMAFVSVFSYVLYLY